MEEEGWNALVWRHMLGSCSPDCRLAWWGQKRRALTSAWMPWDQSKESVVAQHKQKHTSHQGPSCQENTPACLHIVPGISLSSNMLVLSGPCWQTAVAETCSIQIVENAGRKLLERSQLSNWLQQLEITGRRSVFWDASQ